MKCTAVNADFCTLDNLFTHGNYETIKDKMDIFKIHLTQISEGLCSFSLNGRDASGTIAFLSLLEINKIKNFFI